MRREEIIGLVLACVVVGGSLGLWVWLLVSNLWFGGAAWNP